MNEIEQLVVALAEAQEAFEAACRRAPAHLDFAFWPADVQHAARTACEVRDQARDALARVGAALREQLFARAA